MLVWFFASQLTTFSLFLLLVTVFFLLHDVPKRLRPLKCHGCHIWIPEVAPFSPENPSKYYEVAEVAQVAQVFENFYIHCISPLYISFSLFTFFFKKVWHPCHFAVSRCSVRQYGATSIWHRMPPVALRHSQHLNRCFQLISEPRREFVTHLPTTVCLYPPFSESRKDLHINKPLQDF